MKSYGFIVRFSWRSSFLSHQFGRWGVAAELWDSLLSTTVYLSAYVWSRLEMLFGIWPWKLVRNTRSTFEEFLEAPSCCIDEWFGEPFRASYPTLESLESDEVSQLLAAMSRHVCATNMRLESLIAEVLLT